MMTENGIERGVTTMGQGRWVYPLDPKCPAVRQWHRSFDEDPFMAMSGCHGEFLEAFEKSHRVKCKRCQKFGAENVDVEY